MKSNSSLKIILITVGCILIAALSFFFLAGILSSPETYSGIIRSIDDKVETVLKLTASSTAASAGITAIPGDAGTPIAEKLADFSEYGILILCVLYAEKYLLSILGSGVFKFIIPIACVLYPLGFFRDLEGIKPILKKIAIVSLALYFVIPLSVHISDRIYDTYQASIDTTITAAEDLAEDATLAGSTAEDQNAIQRIWGYLSESASSFAERGAEILNRFIESLAVMIVTSCVIPLLVLFFSLWIINQVFGFSIPAPSRHPRLRPHLPGPHRRLGNGSTVTEESEDEDEEKE
jgi:hypothetical protein